MEYIVNSAAFNFYWDLLLREISGTCVQIFFYAIYLNLFIFAIYTLGRRNTAGKGVLLTFTWVMAILGTTQAILRIPTTAVTLRMTQDLVQQRNNLNPGPAPPLELWKTYDSLYMAQDVIFAINNSVADSLFLYRCYVVWGRKMAIILPGVLMISTVVLACIANAKTDLLLGQFDGRIPYILAAATNLVLVMLTAGRIWWKRREAVHIGADEALKNRYSTVIAILVESGALYCIFAIVIVISRQFSQRGIPFIMLQCASEHLVNILPTLIIVRTGLGHNIQDTLANQTTTSTNQRPPACLQLSSSEPSSYPIIDIKPQSYEIGDY
ncbi:hypothetical protein B0H14DRAFT_2667865 [Mycena olivaceomarginata]|nr:hypothetical protein B0H14DRAFT_2667865 [Mycena olivaceomarginata]